MSNSSKPLDPWSVTLVPRGGSPLHKAMRASGPQEDGAEGEEAPTAADVHSCSHALPCSHAHSHVPRARLEACQ